VIAVARRFGDKVRGAPNASGERTGTAVAGKAGVVVDMMAPGEHYERERYWVRFGFPGLTPVFYDWVLAADLRDY
jgi:hypothetical protein